MRYVISKLSLYNCIGGSDYEEQPSTLTFSPTTASNPQCIMVTIIPDDILEVEESFTVVLSTTDRAVNSLPAQSTVILQDTTGM